MKKIAMVMVTSALCARSQSLDLSSLDKFAAKAKEANSVTLTRDQLHAAARLVPMDDGDEKDGVSIKKAMTGLDSIQVRNYEFDEAGQFTDADLDGIRAQVSKLRGCKSIVESKAKKEHSQVFLCTQEGKTTGLVVINSEPKELNVVYIKGSMNLDDLGKLHGMMGVPKMDLGPGPGPHRGNAKPEPKDEDE